MSIFSLADVDMSSPININSQLTKNLAACFIGTPATTGGGKLINLVDKNHLAFVTNLTAFPLWTNMPYGGRGITTDGTNYATGGIQSLIPFIGTGDFTISLVCAWTSTATGIIFGCHNGGNSSGPEFIVNPSAVAGKISFRAAGSGAISDSTLYTDGIIRQFTGVRINGVGNFYTNGKLVATGALTDAVVTPNAVNVANRNATILVTGVFDCGLLYTRGLSAGEVGDLYTQYKTGWPNFLTRVSTSRIKLTEKLPIILSANNTLLFSEIASVIRQRSFLANNTLALSSNAAVSTIKTLAVSNNLTFSETVDILRSLTLQASNTLNISENAAFSAIRVLITQNSFNLNQAAEASLNNAPPVITTGHARVPDIIGYPDVCSGGIHKQIPKVFSPSYLGGKYDR